MAQMVGKYAWRNSSIPGIRMMRRLPSGIRVAVDRNGVEWDIYQTDDNGTVKPYWLATDGHGGYLEAMTLKMVLADVGKAAS